MDVQPFSHFLDALRAWSDEAPRRQGRSEPEPGLAEDEEEADAAEDDFEPLEDVHLGSGSGPQSP